MQVATGGKLVVAVSAVAELVVAFTIVQVYLNSFHTLGCWPLHPQFCCSSFADLTRTCPLLWQRLMHLVVWTDWQERWNYLPLPPFRLYRGGQSRRRRLIPQHTTSIQIGKAVQLNPSPSCRPCFLKLEAA